MTTIERKEEEGKPLSAEQVVVAMGKDGRVAFRGAVARLEHSRGGSHMTIRNFQPAAILYFYMADNGPTLWNCMTRGYAKHKWLVFNTENR